MLEQSNKPTAQAAFVIGDPIIQSKSPLIHQYWLNHYHLSGDYQAHHVLPHALDMFFKKLRAGSFIGGNITAPHKEQALALVDLLTPTAQMIGAINTVYFDENEAQTILIGDNTDAYGFSANLDQYAPHWRQGKTALVIGAGGACRAVLYALKQANYENIAILNRTLSRAEALAEHFGKERFQAGALDDFNECAKQADIIINTSSAHMSDHSEQDLHNFSQCKSTCIITDIVYNPLITPFLISAERANLTIVDGFGMLLHQAVPGFEKWFGTRPDVTDALRKIVLNPETKSL